MMCLMRQLPMLCLALRLRDGILAGIGTGLLSRSLLWLPLLLLSRAALYVLRAGLPPAGGVWLQLF